VILDPSIISKIDKKNHLHSPARRATYAYYKVELLFECREDLVLKALIAISRVCENESNMSNLAKNKEKSIFSTNKKEIYKSLRDQFNVTDFLISISISNSNSFQSSQNVFG
jgi:hypothetical protein